MLTSSLGVWYMRGNLYSCLVCRQCTFPGYCWLSSSFLELSKLSSANNFWSFHIFFPQLGQYALGYCHWPSLFFPHHEISSRIWRQTFPRYSSDIVSMINRCRGTCLGSSLITVGVATKSGVNTAINSLLTDIYAITDATQVTDWLQHVLRNTWIADTLYSQ